MLGGATRTARILVVDGYRGWRIGVGKALEESGNTVWTAHSGRDGLALCRDGLRFDLLLTELELGDMPGDELGRRMRQACPGIRVVFMTHGATGEPLDGGILRKPFSLARLEHTVQRALARRRGAERVMHA